MGNITVAFFSPTGSVGRTAGRIAAGMAAVSEGAPEPVFIDLTDAAADGCARSFGPDETLLAAVPVFGGRVPAAAARRLERLTGNDTPAVAVVVYGNRHYDDSLLEFASLLRGRGFRVAAAAAFVAEHSIVRSIAAGRPDGEDMAAAGEFGRTAALKIAGPAGFRVEPELPGNPDFRPYGGLPFHPGAGRKCVRCGLCARRCPVGAIPETDPKRTDRHLCITCMRCVAVCPYGARRLSRMSMLAARKAIEEKCRERRQPEIFL